MRKIVLSSMTPGEKLEELTKRLADGDNLEKECAKLIRVALANNGKLTLSRRGRPNSQAEAIKRADEVAYLKIIEGVPVKDAVVKVARKHGVSAATVHKNYKHWGRSARSVAPMIKEVTDGRWRRAFDELKGKLRTFRHDNGDYLDKATADDIAGNLPARVVYALNDKIESGPLRRDLELLKELVASLK